MQPQTLDIAISQGASFRLAVTLQAAGTPPTPRDLTGCQARLEIRPKAQSATLYVSVSEVPTTDGRIDIDPLIGKLSIFLTAFGTNKLVRSPVAYDLFLQWPNGEDVWKVLYGAVTCSLAVTEPTYD